MSTWANTPSGLAVVLDYDMNKSTLSSAGLWDVYGSSIAATDGTAPVSPNSVLKSRIEIGATTGGMQLNYAYTAATDVFIGLSWRSNAGFEGRPVGNKMFFVRGPGSNGVFAWGNSALTAGSHSMIWNFNTGGLDNSHITGSSDPSIPLFPNVVSGILTRGNWYRLEAYVKKSTTNTSRNGIVRWWINGTLVGNYTNINYAGAGLNEWVWTEAWDGTAISVTTPWEHYLDHLYIATSSGGGSGGGGGSTPTLTVLVPTSVTLAPGNSQVLTAGMSAPVTSTTTITLASSAPTVASVGASATISPGNSSTNFIVTGVGAGSATITATLGSASQTSTVTVASGGGSSGTPTTYTYASQFSGVQGQNQWSYRDTAGDLLTYNAAASKWEGVELYLAVWSSGFMHGFNYAASRGPVVRWTAPAAGTISITGTAALYDSPAGATFAIQYNSASLFTQAMSASTSYPYSISNQTVASGDVIDFVLTRDSIGTNNNAQLNPVIVFTPTSTGGSGGVTVSSLSPSHGNIGSSVTVVGTGFSTTAVNNTVTVNGVPAVVTSASTTQLIFTVPSGATTGLVNVATSAGSVSAGTFTVDNPTTPDTPPASNFGGSAMLLLVMP